MPRLLVIPAAGLGSRLGAAMPKVLVPVAGVPMLDRLLDLYRAVVDHVVVVVNPAFASDVERHLAARGEQGRTDCVIQRTPTGMLDAMLLGMPIVERLAPESVWITWCDQVAVHPQTVQRLATLTGGEAQADLVMPTVTRPEPYIHLERDRTGRITRVRHRREGDVMPAVGESDMGLFALSLHAYRDLLPMYAGNAEIGHATRERNFLPFIPWVAARGVVTTFPAENPMEAVGINTPEELLLVEAYLRH